MQLGAAPATTPERDETWKALRRARSYLDLQNCYADVLAQIDRALLAPAQPDARDAEIARLRLDLANAAKGRDFEREQRDLRHAAYLEERDKATRLTKELEEARAAADRRQFTTDEAVRLLNIVLRALAPPEPKAETPAEKPAPDFLKGWLAGREAAATCMTALADEMKARADAAQASRHAYDPRDPYSGARYESLRSVQQFRGLADRIRALVPPAETAGQKEGA